MQSLRPLSFLLRRWSFIWMLGMTATDLGEVAADPVPIRPLRPRTAQPKKLPRCRGMERGVDLNGPDFTGTALRQNPPCAPLPQLAEVRLKSGVSIDGKTVLKDVVFAENGLKSAALNGGADKWKGAFLIGASETGSTVRLRIDSVEPAADPKPNTPANENADVWLYGVSVQQGYGAPSHAEFHPNLGPTAEWSPLCPEGKPAIMVPGTFALGAGGGGAKAPPDHQKFTFACVGSALAKCILVMGYKPWNKAMPKSGGAAVSLDALHQACVRAVRADYCGDGESMTQPGERVNFYDRFDIGRDEADWPLEALWSPDGALCINTPRLATAPENPRSGRAPLPVLDYIRTHCPQRLSTKPCDAAANANALLVTESMPAAPKARN